MLCKSRLPDSQVRATIQKVLHFVKSEFVPRTIFVSGCQIQDPDALSRDQPKLSPPAAFWRDQPFYPTADGSQIQTPPRRICYRVVAESSFQALKRGNNFQNLHLDDRYIAGIHLAILCANFHNQCSILSNGFRQSFQNGFPRFNNDVFTKHGAPRFPLLKHYIDI